MLVRGFKLYAKYKGYVRFELVYIITICAICQTLYCKILRNVSCLTGLTLRNTKFAKKGATSESTTMTRGCAFFFNFLVLRKEQIAMSKEVTLSFRMDEEAAEKLENLVKRTQLTKGQILRQLIKGANTGTATFPVVMSIGCAADVPAQVGQ